MRRCHRCDRHVFEASTRCPFCGAAHRVVASPGPVLGVFLGLALSSCIDRPTDDAGGSSTGTTGTPAGSTTSDGATGLVTGMVDGTSTSTGVATTAMSVTATDDGTTSTGGTSDGTTVTTGTSDTGDGTTTGPGTLTVPPYAGAFPDDDQSSSTTG
jgi:hypothetical protein